MLDKKLLDILVCPVTKGKLTLKQSELWSNAAGLAYPVKDGIPMLVESAARALTSEEIEQLKSEKK